MHRDTLKNPKKQLCFLCLILIFISLFSITIFPSTITVALQCDDAWYQLWLTWYGQTSPPASSEVDLNHDGIVNGQDYVIWLNNYGANCPSDSIPDIPPQPTIDTIATAQGTNPNFPNLRAYCQSIGYQDMQVAGTDVYSVYCVRNGTELAPFEMNSVCQSMYGEGYSVSIFDVGNPYGWTCENNTSQTDPTAEPDNPGNQPPRITGNAVPTGTFSYKANANNVNVRSGPGTNYSIIGQISPDSGYFEGIGASNGWIHIRFPGGHGWVNMSYLTPAGGDIVTPLPTEENGNPIPVVPTTAPPVQACPAGTGPGGITAGGYTPEKLTQDQRQWLFTIFGNSGTAPEGYGGQPCSPSYGSGDDNYRAYVCSRAERGPSGILPGSYDATTLTQEQRQWLFTQFGNQGIAPDGYGGETCPVTPVPQCPSGIGPGGITAGGYTPQALTQEQRQWLYEQFGHSGTAPEGYGGETCTGGQVPLPQCPDGVGEPGSFVPTTLTQQQRNELFHAFGHEGEAPEGYGGEACYGGIMNLPSFTQTVVTPIPQPTIDGETNIPIDEGSAAPIGTLSLKIISGERLNIREFPSLDSRILAQAMPYKYFEILAGPENGWYKIRFSSGEGWVNEKFVQVTHIQNDLPTLFSEVNVNVKQGPDESCLELGTMQPGQTYTVEGKNSGSSWLQITFNGEQGWVNASYVTLNDPSLMFIVPNTEHSSTCLLLQTMDQITSDPSAQLTPEQQEILIAELERGLRQAGYTAQEAARISREIQYHLLSIGVSCAVPIGVILSGLIAARAGLDPNSTMGQVTELLGSAFLSVGVSIDASYQCAAEFTPFYVR